MNLLAVLLIATAPAVEAPTLWRMLASPDFDVPAAPPAAGASPDADGLTLSSPGDGPAAGSSPDGGAKLSPAPDGDVQVEVAAILGRLGRADEWRCIHPLFQAESGWLPDNVGDRHLGGSYGLPQRHAPVWGKPSLPWPVEDQVVWTLDYADGRYGGMCEAWDAWSSRANSDGKGGWW